MSNVHDPKFREAKPPQGGRDKSITDLFSLDERTIVISGGSGFLGTEVSITVLQSGGDVIVLDIAQAPNPEAWKLVTAAAETNSGKVSYFSTDTTNAQAVADVFAKFELRYPIRGLVACAGVSENGPSVDFPVSTFKRVLDINVTSTFIVAQAVAREIQKTHVTGSMILIASMSGYVSNKGVDTAAYNSSKAAVHQLARSLAAEWGSRKGFPFIRVNSLSPGYIRTAATAEALTKPGMEAQWQGDNMMYRLSTVDEYRAPVLFLLGDGSSFVTASDLRVDGGHCAW